MRSGMFTLNLNTNDFEKLFQSKPFGVHLVNSKGEAIFVNDTACSFYQMAPDDVFGESYQKTFPKWFPKKSIFKSALMSKEPLLMIPQHFTTKSGITLYTVANVIPIFDKKGKIYALKFFWKLPDGESIPKSKRKIRQLYTFDDFITSNPSLIDIKKKAKRIADTPFPVFISGATGTGKEIFAQAIHNDSSRKNYPFITQNCAAIPDTLLESTLFGTVKGAYTNAEGKLGLLEIADKGTIYFDEIDSMPLQLQIKLLRFLEEGCFRRVGDTKLRNVDIRIICSSSIPPKRAIENEKLRKDLFFRVSTVCFNLPELCDRKEDIILLANYFCERVHSQFKIDKILTIKDEVKELFINYDWPGNVRELKHVIEACAVLSEDGTIHVKDMPSYIKSEMLTEHIKRTRSESFSLKYFTEEFEETLISRAMKESKGNVSRASRLLKMPRSTLQRKLKRLSVQY